MRSVTCRDAAGDKHNQIFQTDRTAQIENLRGLSSPV